MELAPYRAELNERLIVHFTGGAWRVPLGERHLEIADAAGARLGRIICAAEADASRALGGLETGRDVPLAALTAALAPFASLLESLCQTEAPRAAPMPQPSLADGTGPALLLSAASTPPGQILALISRFLPAGVIWKPAPGAAASAHLIARALTPLTGGGLAFLHGDHASGAALHAALAGQGRLVWAGSGAVPSSFGG